MYSQTTWKLYSDRKQGTLLNFARISALGAVGYALLCAATPVASADVITTYQFVAGTSITWASFGPLPLSPTNTSTVSGQFSYDSTTMTLSAVDVTLGGGGAEAGVYTIPFGASPTDATVYSTGAGGYVAFVFAAPLDGILDDLATPAESEQFCAGCGGGGATESYSATGGVIPIAEITTTPEPSSLVLFGLVLAGLGLLRRKLIVREYPR